MNIKGIIIILSNLIKIAPIDTENSYNPSNRSDDKMNIKLPHNAHSISKLGIEISMNHIKSGDLLCFGSRDRIYHIGIFYKKDNRPSVIHCISSGVKIDEDIQWNYWKKRIGKIVRVCSN